MVNNWQCFKHSQSQVVYKKIKKTGDVFSSSLQGPRFQFLFCLYSLLTHYISDLRRKSLTFSPSLFGIPQMEHRATTLILHPPYPLFHSLSLWQSRVTCYSLLCLAWVPHSQRQGQDFTGVAIRISTSQSTHRVRQGSRVKIRKGSS